MGWRVAVVNGLEGSSNNLKWMSDCFSCQMSNISLYHGENKVTFDVHFVLDEHV